MKGVLHHIEINVSDLQKSIEFWDWLLKELGYAQFQNWKLGKSYKFDNTYIVFVQTEEQFLDVRYHRKRTGLNHLAFFGDSKEFIDGLLFKLKEKKVKVLYENKYPFAENYYAIYFEDPDRIKVEVIAYPYIYQNL